MRKTADAVIIGGGVIGASLLYHLTQKGLKNAVLLEKGELCSGSTGDSAAIVRQHYSNDVSIHLVKKSLEIFQHLPEVFNRSDIFSNTGWFFLCPPEAANIFKDNMARLKRLGVQTWEVAVQEAAKEIPGLNTDGIGCVAYEPESGWTDPHRLVDAFVQKAKVNGAEVCLHSPARSIKRNNGKGFTVVVEKGEVQTPIVVNAAGPWAKTVGSWLGIDLPLEISREQDAIFQPPAAMPPLRHAVSVMVDRVYLRPEPGGMILAGTGHPKKNEPADPNNYNHQADPAFIDDVTRRLLHRVPLMKGAKVVKGWAGLYTITPDWNMILDKCPGMDGFYLAVGGSGHSFKLAPAIGLCMAELIVDGKATTVDITPLRATRFEKGEMLRSTYGGNRA